MTRPAHLALLAAAVAALGACGAAVDEPDPVAAPGSTTGSGLAPDDPAVAEEAPGASAPRAGIPVGLLLRVVRIERPDGQVEAAPTLVTLRLGADGRTGGNLGCNDWGGRWSPADAAIPAESVMRTAALCDPPDWQAFDDLLAAGAEVVPVLGGVELRAADGTTAVAEPLDLVALLAGGRFVLAGTITGDVSGSATDPRATIRLAAGGEAYGRLGCSPWAGRWRVEDEGLRIDGISVIELGICAEDVHDRPRMRRLLAEPIAVRLGQLGAVTLELVGADGRGLLLAPDKRPAAQPCGEAMGAPLAVDPTWSGLSLPEAAARAAEEGLVLRIACQDGEQQWLTADLRRDRVNLDVVDGHVVGVGRF